MASDPAQDRIAELEAEIAQLRNPPDIDEGLRSLNLTIESVRTKASADEELGFAASTVSSFCCVATVSSASSYCVVQDGDFSAIDPETAQAFVTLHRRAVEVMGEEGTVDAIIAQAKDRGVMQLETPPAE